MTEKEAQEKAAALLPCDMPHDSRCPCRYRPAVAEALWAAASNTYEAKEWAVASDEYEAEIAALQKHYDSDAAVYKAEIAALKAENERLNNWADEAVRQRGSTGLK